MDVRNLVNSMIESIETADKESNEEEISPLLDRSEVSDDLKNVVLRVINTLKKRRNRACFQNIVDFTKREVKSFDMECCKNIVSELLNTKQIIDTGKYGKESFKVLSDEDMETKSNDIVKEPSYKNNFATPNKLNSPAYKNNIDLNTLTLNSDIDDTEKFINDKFYESLLTMIHVAVNDAVKNKDTNNYSYDKQIIDMQNQEIEYLRKQLDNVNLQRDNFIKNHIISNLNTDQSQLIDTLKIHIKYLKNELTNKDEIIKLLLADHKSYTNTILTKNMNMEKNDNNDTLNVSKNVKSMNTVADDKKSQPNEDTSNKEKTVPWYIDEANDTNSEFKKVTNKKKRQRNIVILGDSMINNIDREKVQRGLYNNDKVYVKSFPGATSKDMESYSTPIKDYENDLIILHCGTNDLKGNKSPAEIAKEIFRVANNLKTQTNEVMISGIVPRRDNLQEKGKMVNSLLLSACAANDFHYIDNSNVDIYAHLNRGGLHLNFKGTYRLGSNFVDAIRI